MAKELHDWGRYILLAIVIIFGTGGWAVTVRDNTADISILQEDTRIIKDDIHELQLSDFRIANLTQNTSMTMEQVLSELVAIRKEQAKQATIQAINSEKLKTLTRNE
jgi:hypothetical protein